MTDEQVDREAGFTLLEMLIAVSLLALIGVYLSSAVGTGRRAWEMRDRIEDSHIVSAVRGFFHRQIEQAWPTFQLTETGEHRLVFSGQSDRIEFVSPISDGTNWGGLYRIAISKEVQGDNVAIHIIGDLFRSDGIRSAAAFDRRLLDSVESLEFAYFGSPSSDLEAAWFDHWKPESGLPRLVRVRIGFPPGSSLAWPDLIVNLQLQSF